jgi:hypothetical protein
MVASPSPASERSSPDGDDGNRHQQRQYQPWDAAGGRRQIGEDQVEIGHKEEPGRRHWRQVDEADDERQQIAAGDAEQDRYHGKESAQDQREDEHRAQGGQGDDEMEQAVGAADRGIGGHADGDAGQAKADHHDHRPDDDRRQQPQQPADTEQPDQHGDDEIDEAGAEGAEHRARGAGHLSADDDRPDEGEGRA